jgi:hypothetical protein
MPNPLVAAIGVGGSIISGKMQSDAASSAADQQQAAALAALAERRRMYEEQKGFLKPYQEQGTIGLNELSKLSPYQKFDTQQFQADPGYQFRLQEGLKQLRGQAAARGGALSGATLKGVQKYGQGLASQEYENAFNRYQQEWKNKLYLPTYKIGLGENAARTLAGIGGQESSAASELLQSSGNAAAAGTVGRANAWSNALSNIGNMGVQYGMMGGFGGGVPQNTTTYGPNSLQSQIGYSNAGYNPGSGYYEVNF